jgi:subtilisin family serine protease
MKIKHLIAVLYLLVLMPADFLFASDINQSLAGKISSLNPNEKIGVVIALKENSALSALKKEIPVNYKTAADRHRYSLEVMKTRAISGQKSILAYLGELEIIHQASNIKGHWIINVITADIDAGEIEKIAAREEVASIFEMPKAALITPTEAGITEDAKLLAGVTANIKAIGADSAWKLGYTGEGRIICSFDTGVEGLHPAITNNWKGLDGDSSAAWFDPIKKLPYPHTIANSEPSIYNHGTHTMGIMVGHDDITGDTIGVAPDAKWISAAVIDIAGASIIDAFEWAADPDGNPNTISDIPDVINHSWGVNNFNLGCDEYFWQMIDNTEALGIVNIFAAGNSGPIGFSIVNPANRAKDSLDCFAVGNINADTKIVYSNSSIGPSDCDNISIKPNVVAPGVSIRSSIPSIYYGYMTGTSMAAPHVAGAVAILRQYAPNATPNEIKEALLAGCEPLPTADSSPNNNYGWGLINIPASMQALSPQLVPLLKVYSVDHAPVNPGDTIEGYVFIKNFGNTLNGVYGLIGHTNGGINALVNSLQFGQVMLGDTSCSDILFRATIDDTVTAGSMLSVDMTLISATSDTQNVKLYIRVGNAPEEGFHTHINDLIKFTVSNLGQYGFANGSMIPLGYDGFKLRDTNYLFEGSFMIGIDSAHVSDGARNIIEELDNDFAPAPGGDLVISIPGSHADEETFSIFNDSKAEQTLDLQISQKTYSWENAPNNTFVILEYEINNLSQSDYTGLYAGLFLDWDIIGPPQNRGGFSYEEELGYLYYQGISINRYMGVSLLKPEQVASYDMRHNPIYPETTPLLTELAKFEYLSSGIIDTLDTLAGDLAQIISVGPFDLISGGSVKIAFALMASDSLTGLKAAALQAGVTYNTSVGVDDELQTILPTTMALEQNHPNPFNSSTSIKFTLSTKSHLKLEIINILGRKVKTLIDAEFPAGQHTIEWDATDDAGQPVSSGVYFYRLKSLDRSNPDLQMDGDQILVRKMVLLK